MATFVTDKGTLEEAFEYAKTNIRDHWGTQFIHQIATPFGIFDVEYGTDDEGDEVADIKVAMPNGFFVVAENGQIGGGIEAFRIYRETTYD